MGEFDDRAPEDLAAPLIRSMEHQMFARDDSTAATRTGSTGVAEMLAQAAIRRSPCRFQATKQSNEIQSLLSTTDATTEERRGC